MATHGNLELADLSKKQTMAGRASTKFHLAWEGFFDVVKR